MGRKGLRIRLEDIFVQNLLARYFDNFSNEKNNYLIGMIGK